MKSLILLVFITILVSCSSNNNFPKTPTLDTKDLILAKKHLKGARTTKDQKYNIIVISPLPNGNSGFWSIYDKKDLEKVNKNGGFPKFESGPQINFQIQLEPGFINLTGFGKYEIKYLGQDTLILNEAMFIRL